MFFNNFASDIEDDIKKYDSFPEYKIIKEWDIESALYKYSFYKKNHIGDVYLMPVYDLKGKGNLDWARKNAKHYNIDIKDEDD